MLRPSNSWIPVWIPASRARAECSLSKQPHARARIVPRTRGAFHRCVFFALSSRSTSPMRQPVASQQPHSVTSRRCLQVRQVMASSVRAAHRGSHAPQRPRHQRHGCTAILAGVWLHPVPAKDTAIFFCCDCVAFIPYSYRFSSRCGAGADWCNPKGCCTHLHLFCPAVRIGVCIISHHFAPH